MSNHNIVIAVPLDPEFIADCAYGPGGMLIDEILEINAQASRVQVRMPTHADLPITREQRAHPLRHPRHVSGGLMVHMTGVVAVVHAYYLLSLKHKDGWVGYGARIHRADFRALAAPGEPLVLQCQAKQIRKGSKKVLARYNFEFYQGQTLVYEGDQTAMWMRVQEL